MPSYPVFSRFEITLLVCATVLLAVAQEAPADILEVDDPIFGPGTITRDTRTGLEWLDLNESRPLNGRSFNDVVGEFGVGGDFEGFRHATRSEVEQLFFQSAGIMPGTHDPGETSLATLQTLVGITAPAFSGVCPSNSSIGLYDDSIAGNDLRVGSASLSRNVCTGMRTTTAIADDATSPDARGFFTGHWLVRDTPTLVSIDDAVFGPDTITRDNGTGIEWLDLNESRPFGGRSFSDVANEFGPGGDYEGFRHATRAEVEQLFFQSARITPGRHEPQELALARLRDLVGVTQPGFSGINPPSFSNGLYDDSASGSTPSVGRASLRTTNPAPTATSEASIRDDSTDPNSIGFFDGHWLVRDVRTPVSCDIQMSRASYDASQDVIARVLRIKNETANITPVEIKVWLSSPTEDPLVTSYFDLGSDGSVELLENHDEDFGPQVLMSAGDVPAGRYSFNCRLLDPITGDTLDEDLNRFDIQ